jgi:hypothetical protein
MLRVSLYRIGRCFMLGCWLACHVASFAVEYISATRARSIAETLARSFGLLLPPSFYVTTNLAGAIITQSVLHVLILSNRSHQDFLSPSRELVEGEFNYECNGDRCDFR